MADLPWKIFSQTGNIEAYLLMKEMETMHDQDGTCSDFLNKDMTELDTQM
ncbi:YqzL family protein [Radiobacillus sp. PE A8.2]